MEMRDHSCAPEAFSTLRLRLAVAAAAVAWAASPARAQPEASTAAPVIASEVSADQVGRLDDANINRGWFMPTAMTQPAGSLSFSSYEVILMGVTYAPIDRLEISATFLTPIVPDMCCWGILGGKVRLVDAGRFHFAALGQLFLASAQGIDLYDTGKTDRSTLWAALGGGTASVCLDESCRALVSAWALTGLNQYSSKTEWPIIYGGSLTFGHHVKLLLEADSAALIGDVTMAARGALVTYGVRFTGRNLAGDIGFTRPFSSDTDLGSLFLGIPIVTFTYRAL